MTKVVTLPDRDRVFDEASSWLAKLDRGLSADEHQELEDWLAAEAQHTEVLLQMAQLWDKMDALSRLSQLFPEYVERSPTSYPSWLMAVVCLLVMVSLPLIFWQSSSDWLNEPQAQVASLSESGMVYQTDLGEQSTVTLIDGTQLALNTDTQVQVRYTDQARLVHLLKGEVYVQVAKDAERPLSVLAHDQAVQAVGTAFNVELENEAVDLVVTEGKVRVGVWDKNQSLRQMNSLSMQSPSVRFVVAGEEVKLTQRQELDVGRVRAVTTDDMDAKLSWRNGNLIFRGESLVEAVKEVERYTSVDFVIVDEELKQLRVAGLFRAGDVRGLLSALSENFNIEHRYKNDQTVELSLRSP